VLLGDAMARCLAPNTLLVSENFNASDHLMPFGYGEDQWRMVRTCGGSLGYGLGAAIGAQLGAPQRPVVLSIGDGSVMYSASGFWTMARYHLPILTIVWNNQQYQTVRANFATWGGNMKAQNRYPETFLGDPAIDFVMLAKAQGIEGLHVHERRARGGAAPRPPGAGGRPALRDRGPHQQRGCGSRPELVHALCAGSVSGPALATGGHGLNSLRRAAENR
jgi:hypothetical protein